VTHYGEPLTVTTAEPVTRPIPALKPLTDPPVQPPGRSPAHRADLYD
jgi:alpha,alpha-trehalose phosphorylase